MLRIGRITYSFAMVGFGVLCLTYLDFVHQLQPLPAFPGYRIVAVATGAILIAAGLAIATGVRDRLAAIVLTVMFGLWIVTLQVPSAFIEPSLLRSPWWVRTFETVAMSGAALIVAALVSDPVRERWVRTGRIAFGVSLPVFGILHLVYPQSVASLVPPWYPWPLFWAYLTGLAQLFGGIAIATGVLPRLVATLAGVMYGSWALTLHIPRNWCRIFGPCEFLDDVVGWSGSRPGLTSQFVAVAMAGAAWIVAGSLTTRRESSP